MDERLKETLSAMMDDQADELAVRRVLSQADKPEVREQWHRWQQLRSLMHDERRDLASVDVSAAVSAALDEASSQMPAPKAPVQVSSVRRSMRWSAVAAVSLALLVGFGAGAQWGVTSEEGNLALAAGVAAPAGQGEPEMNAVPEIALQGLDEEQREQMSRYLLEHAQHNSVGMGYGTMGYARVASASTGVR
ncbi:sigma-E factor negative regulatory protein [Marinobacter fonticola]|uniref:sigma-E factor negative regulatory protein n=1 Tax=Marinobacter fonticola TaxID=2603215 RepID=UPI0011E7FDFE|nr:sigma-E factor negative regulatory protein [Marinobacter fonticola]